MAIEYGIIWLFSSLTYLIIKKCDPYLFVCLPKGSQYLTRSRQGPTIFSAPAPWTPQAPAAAVARCWRAPCCRHSCAWAVMSLYGNVPSGRRKFRSQTANFRQHGQMKSRDGKSQRREEKRREEERERVRRKKIQVREKVAKWGNNVFFQWFEAPEGRKVGSLKRRVRSQLARWEMKNCTPLWREANFQVKMYKTHQVRTTFGNWDVEKVHAVVARSTFASEKAKNTSRSEHFWKLTCRKSACRSGAKHVSKSKCTKHTRSGPLFGSWDVEKVHAVLARSTFPSQNVQSTPGPDHFLEVEMSKKCTPLWREAHFEVKMLKKH